MKKIDIVLVGFSGYGEFYTDFLFQNPYDLDYNFKAVADPFLSDEDKSTLQKKNILYFSDLEEFFENHKADLTIIAAPIHLHKSLCETAVRNGSTVLCEKPTTARISDLYEMHDYEAKYKKDIFIGFQWSFATPILGLKKDLIAGKFGEILSCKAIVLWPRNLEYYSRTTGWAGKIRTGDGLYVYDSVASNATAHYLNNLLFLLGNSMETSVELDKISAECYKVNPIESFDTCIIKAQTVKNQEILFAASHTTEKSMDPIFEIKCEKAVIHCDFAKNNGLLTAEFTDGEIKSYGEVSTIREQHQKIISVINWLSDPVNSTKPVSTVMTTLSFTQVINHLFEEVEFVKPSSKVVLDEPENRYYADGLFEKLVDTYQAN